MAEFYINIDGDNVIADITFIDTQAAEAPEPASSPFNVTFKAKVIESQDPTVNVDEVIEGVLSYNLEFTDDYNLANPFLGGSGGGMPNHYMVYDETTGSQIKANLPNGLTFRTSYSALPFLTLDSQITDHNNGIYQREASFTSGRSMSNLANIHMGMYFKETLSELPNILKTDWSKSLNDYAEFCLGVNGQYIVAELTELALDIQEKPPAIVLNSSLSLSELPSQGGELTINSNIINNIELSMSLKHSQYIIMLGEHQYPITLPTAHTLTDFQTHLMINTFTVSASWPAGTYIHHITTIAVEDGQVFSKSTSFTKSE